MFEPESFAFSAKLLERKDSARRTLREASVAELRALITELFAGDETHPFAEMFSRFVKEHEQEQAVRGETSDGFCFVY
jgi:hypothetical protein